MRPLVRSATAADAPALAELRYEFRASVGRVAESKRKFLARCSKWMRRRLRRRGPWHCWVWERAGAVEGHLWLELIDKIPNPTPEPEHHAYVTNMYVRARARGGAGTKLLGAALAWCRAQEVDQVILWATERSRRLYARHGFELRADLMALTPGGVARDRPLGRGEVSGRNST
jgi:GNAT superfamily N-acetyltransferase